MEIKPVAVACAAVRSVFAEPSRPKRSSSRLDFVDEQPPPGCTDAIHRDGKAGQQPAPEV